MTHAFELLFGDRERRLVALAGTHHFNMVHDARFHPLCCLFVPIMRQEVGKATLLVGDSEGCAGVVILGIVCEAGFHTMMACPVAVWLVVLTEDCL